MIKVIRQVLLALLYLHEDLNVIHGDIKTENLLIKNDAKTARFIPPEPEPQNLVESLFCCKPKLVSAIKV